MLPVITPTLRRQLICIWLLLLATYTHAVAPIHTSAFNNLALSGYDAVSYFHDGAPSKGRGQLSTTYKGAEWRFSEAEHLAAFISDPDKYAPQFGGYCAWAVAHNNTAKGDPLEWTIHNDKLYLNYNASIKARWRADKEAKIKAAEANWPTLLER